MNGPMRGRLDAQAFNTAMQGNLRFSEREALLIRDSLLQKSPEIRAERIQ